MIQIERKDEPEQFDRDVRQKGIKTLKKKGLEACLAAPYRSEEHGCALTTHWRHIREEFYNCYGGICHYLGRWIPFHAFTIDHFYDKAHFAGLAYEWSNYRLSTSGINSKKQNTTGLLDPFTMPHPTFSLDSCSGTLQVINSLPLEEKQSAVLTINTLGLNNFQNSKDRTDCLSDFIEGQISLEFVKKRLPFLYSEIMRQGIVQRSTQSKADLQQAL